MLGLKSIYRATSTASANTVPQRRLRLLELLEALIDFASDYALGYANRDKTLLRRRQV